MSRGILPIQNIMGFSIECEVVLGHVADSGARIIREIFLGFFMGF